MNNNETIFRNVFEAVVETAIEVVFETVLDTALDTLLNTVLETALGTVIETPFESTVLGINFGDSYNDPFGGADPFPTPIAGNPFELSTTYDFDDQQDSDEFEPRNLQDLFELVEKDLLMMSEIEELKDFLKLADVDLNEDVDINV